MKTLLPSVAVCIVSISLDAQYFNTSIFYSYADESNETIEVTLEFENDILAFVEGSTNVQDLLPYLYYFSGNGVIQNIQQSSSNSISYDILPRVDGPVVIFIPDGLVYDAFGNTNYPAWLTLEHNQEDEIFEFVGGLPGSIVLLNAAASEDPDIQDDPIAYLITDMESNANGEIFIQDVARNSTLTPIGLAPHELFAGLGIQEGGFLNGPKLLSAFDLPVDAVFDMEENLFIADAGNHRIRKIDADGEVTTIAGTGNPGVEEGSALTADITVNKLTIASDGSVYFLDGYGVICRLFEGQVTRLLDPLVSGVLAIEFRSNGNLLIAGNQGLSEINIAAPSKDILVNGLAVLDIKKDENDDFFLIVAGDDTNENSINEIGLLNLFKMDGVTNEFTFLGNLDALAMADVPGLNVSFLVGLLSGTGVDIANAPGNNLYVSIGSLIWTLDLDRLVDDSMDYVVDLQEQICQGEHFILGNQVLSMSGEYSELFTSSHGTDSLVNLSLTVNPIFTETAEASICNGDSFIFGTQTLITAGDYSELFLSQAGCDSTVTLTLSIVDSYNETVERNICEGEVFAFGNQSLANPGDYAELFVSQTGCDSLVNLTLIVSQTFNETAEATICNGDSFTFGSQILTTTGDHSELFTSQMGCDSTVTLTLNVNPIFDETVETTICHGDSFTFGTQTLTTSGNYSELYISQEGCDSTVTLILDVVHLEPELSRSGATLHVNPIPGATYQWIDCENQQPISGETAASYSPTTSGSYALQVHKDGCLETTICEAVETPLGRQNNLDVSIYPNPTDGLVWITLNNSVEGTCQIYDISGELIRSIELSGSSETDLMLNGPAGLYMLKLKQPNGSEKVFRIIKL